jgi:hypothetical protein
LLDSFSLRNSKSPVTVSCRSVWLRALVASWPPPPRKTRPGEAISLSFEITGRPILKLVKRQYRRNFGRRLINSIVSASIRLGVGPSCRYELTVPGRRTRLSHTTPVSVVTDGAMRYLVGPYGETGWVRNARAAGSVTLTRAGSSERFALQELTRSAAVPILRRYLELEPVTRPYFDIKPDVADESFAVEAASHPVFLLMPIGN